MSSKAEQIAQAFVALATSPALAAIPAARVFRDINRAMATSELPAMAIEMGNETAPARNLIQHEDRALSIHVHVLSGAVASDASPYTSGDAALVEFHARVLADLTLGGLALDVREGETLRNREMVGDDLAQVRKTYNVEYRTAVGTL